MARLLLAVLLLPLAAAPPVDVSALDCGDAAGDGCPETMCIAKGYIGRGRCTETESGAWRWHPGAPAEPSADTHSCGEAAGDGCPQSMCVPKEYGRGACARVGRFWKWHQHGAVQPPPPPPATGSASASGGTDGGGVAGWRSTGIGALPASGGGDQSSKTTTSESKPASGADANSPTGRSGRNCGAAAGAGCPDFMCVPAQFAGKGECTEEEKGWVWRSGPMPVPFGVLAGGK